jgi:hypothetical protein
VQQLILGAPDHTEAAGAEAFEQTITTMQETSVPWMLTGDARRGMGGMDRGARDGRRRRLSGRSLGRGAGPRETVLDEGFERVHRMARSPPIGVLPA